MRKEIHFFSKLSSGEPVTLDELWGHPTPKATRRNGFLGLVSSLIFFEYQLFTCSATPALHLQWQISRAIAETSPLLISSGSIRVNT